MPNSWLSRAASSACGCPSEREAQDRALAPGRVIQFAQHAEAVNSRQAMPARRRADPARAAAIAAKPILCFKTCAATAMATMPTAFGVPEFSRRNGLGGQVVSGGRDEIDRAAADLVGRRGREQPRVAQEHAGPERGVHLVAWKGQKVEMVALPAAAHRDRPMPCQLCRVDEHQAAVAMRDAGDLADAESRPPVRFEAPVTATSTRPCPCRRAR